MNVWMLRLKLRLIKLSNLFPICCHPTLASLCEVQPQFLVLFLCCCSCSASRFGALFIQRRFSAFLDRNKWLFKLQSPLQRIFPHFQRIPCKQQQTVNNFVSAKRQRHISQDDNKYFAIFSVADEKVLVGLDFNCRVATKSHPTSAAIGWQPNLKRQ